jgi:flagellar hook-associated protein 3 FlgL
MRVTQGMMTDSFLSDLYKANSKFLKLGQQMSSNKRILRPSDDAIGTTRSIKVRGDISELDQFTSNVKDAEDYLSQVETSLSQIDTMYVRLIELGEQSLDGATDESNLESISAEVKQLQEELLQVSNATYAGKFVFGGFNTTKEPFKLDDAGNLLYNGIDIINDPDSLGDEETDVLTYQLANSVTFELGYNGVDLLGKGEDNLYNVLTKFVNDLESGNYSNSEGFVSKLKDGQKHILSLEADIGAKQNRLTYMEDRYADDSLNFEERRSNIEDIDQAEVISNMKLAQVIYQATLQANSMILQPTLLNYL